METNRKTLTKPTTFGNYKNEKKETKQEGNKLSKKRKYTTKMAFRIQNSKIQVLQTKQNYRQCCIMLKKIFEQSKSKGKSKR